MSDREAAWWRLHDALQPGWRLGDLTYDPATGEYGDAGMSPRPHGRGKPPERVVDGRSPDGVAAVDALAELLRDDLIRWLREAFIAGAEEDSRRRLGRGLTAEELERVLQRYPGDVGDRPRRRRHVRGPFASRQLPRQRLRWRVDGRL